LTITLSNSDVDGVMDPLEFLRFLEEFLRGDGVESPRSSIEYGGSWFGVMPAAGGGFYSVKLVGVYPGNRDRGLPLVRGKLLLFSASDGELLLEADAEAPTGWRTAAATILSLKLLGYRGGGVLGVIGSGIQAQYHLRVFTGVYSVDGILVYSPTMHRAERLARLYGGRYSSLASLLNRSNVVIAATTSREPVVRGDMLSMNTIVASIGAPKPVREVDKATISRAGCILVDTMRVLEESGDVTPDTTIGARLYTIRDVLKGGSCRWREIGLYKSVGTPLLDLAIAIYLYRKKLKAYSSIYP